MASSAPSSPARHHAHRLADLQTRSPLLTTRSIPSSPSRSSVAAALLSPRRHAPAAAAAAMTPPTSFSPSPSPSPPVSFTPVRSPPVSAAPVAGTLRVEVISARNLHAAVLGSLLKWTANTSNPYVVITLHRDVFTTTTKDQTLNPTWKEMGQLPVPLPSEQELLQTVGMHRSIYDTGSGHSSDTAAKLATQKLMPKSLSSSSTGPGEFHPCFPHLHVQVFHRSADGEQDQGPGSPSRRRALDKLIGEVAVPILPCLMANTSSHRAWYTLLSDEHPDAGQIQLAMHYDVDNGLEPIKGDIVRLAGFGGMEYYAKLVNANARLDVVDVFQDQVLVQYKSLENWMLSFEVHRNLLFVVRRPSMLRDAQSQLQGQIVRVRHSPLVAKAHRVWQVIPASQRRQLHHLYDLAILSGGAVYSVMAKSVETTLHDGVQAGVKTCVNGTTEAVNQVSHEALHRFWWDSTSGQKHVLTRTEELARYLEGGPLGGRGKVVQAFGDLEEEEKVDESYVAFTVDADEEEDEEPELFESKPETLRDEDEEKTNDDDENGDEDVPEQLLCPITGCLMIDPVVAADGHTYEREAIVQWFAGSNKSPMTGAQMETTQVFPNFTLKRMSQELQDQRRAAMRPL